MAEGQNLGAGGIHFRRAFEINRLEPKKEGHPIGCPSFLEQVKGVEPSYQAWEACVLPMNYTCGNFV